MLLEEDKADKEGRVSMNKLLRYLQQSIKFKSNSINVNVSDPGNVCQPDSI